MWNREVEIVTEHTLREQDTPAQTFTQSQSENDYSDFMVQFVEAFVTNKDRAAQLPKTEMDTTTDLQPLLHSRSLSVCLSAHSWQRGPVLILWQVTYVHAFLYIVFAFIVSICLVEAFTIQVFSTCFLLLMWLSGFSRA